MKTAMGSRFLIVALLSSLVGCGPSTEQVAVDLCEQGLKERLGDQVFTVDKQAMLKAVTSPDSSGISEISATAKLDPDGSLNFMCRLQYDPANPKKPPEVIFVQTN
ncbi:hypothetical protein C7S18_16565 [Ahniella affigens]|uniref:Lipoprotein n=1 Tax=Ahniella affigens TaxID=2021234 RepID=A0A2P1PV52_9GAMM|nr:hypothetical protein [Ahniella affigens]AVP98702.1 hypothetical protein C7S18_16565 [Ahniella affigens]